MNEQSGLMVLVFYEKCMLEKVNDAKNSAIRRFFFVIEEPS